MSEESANTGGVSRRTLLRLGAAGGAGAALVAAQGWAGPLLAQKGLLSPDGAFAATSTALGDLMFYIEAFPTSPLILTPFTDPLPIPKALAPGADSRSTARWTKPPGPGTGPAELAAATSSTRSGRARSGYPDPIVYKIDLLVADARLHHLAGAADRHERPARRSRSTRPARPYPAGTKRTLPPSTIYGFNGTFPGPDDQRRVRQAGRWSGSRTTWTRTR